MTTDNDSHSEQRKYTPAALFLETSAQILRLQGPGEIQKGIRQLIKDTRKNSGQIGTSAHVKREFLYVVNGFFDEVEARIGLLTDPETDRPIEQLWREVRDIQMPRFFLGGRSLLDDLGDYITDLYKGRWVRPMFLASVVATYRARVLRGFKAFKVDQFFDKSSCEVWEPPKGTCTSCDSEPSLECRLKDTCVTERPNFLTWLTTLAHSDCDESDWLSKNLETLHSLEGKALHEFIAEYPGHLGDAIIFSEVPDGWTILSRDKAFQILKNKRQGVEFFKVRIPRKISGKTCRLRPDGTAEEVEGTLDNYNSTGARVYAPGLKVRTRQLIDIHSEELTPPRAGRVTPPRKPASPEEAKRSDQRPTIGLKFTTVETKT